MFAGNTGDPATVAAQVTKVKDRFGIIKVVLVGDRGMLTAARLRERLRLDLPLSDLMEQSTIAHWTRVVKRALKADGRK